MKEDQKAWAEDERSRHIFAINKTWDTAGFFSQLRFNERKKITNTYGGTLRALSGYLAAGKTGKGNPKDDWKNGVINVFAPVWKVPFEISRSKTAFFIFFVLSSDAEVFRFANQKCLQTTAWNSEATSMGIFIPLWASRDMNFLNFLQ